MSLDSIETSAFLANLSEASQDSKRNLYHKINSSGSTAVEIILWQNECVFSDWNFAAKSNSASYDFSSTLENIKEKTLTIPLTKHHFHSYSEDFNEEKSPFHSN